MLRLDSWLLVVIGALHVVTLNGEGLSPNPRDIGVVGPDSLSKPAEKILLPKEVGEKLLSHPGYLQPASRELVRQWMKTPLFAVTANDLEILEDGLLSDDTLVDWIRSKNQASQRIGLSLLTRTGRPEAFKRLRTEINNETRADERRVLIQTYVMATNPDNNARKKLARDAVLSGWDGTPFDATIWRIAFDLLDPKVFAHAAQRKDLVGDYLFQVMFIEFLEKTITKNGIKGVPKEAMDWFRSLLSGKSGSQKLAAAVAAKYFPEEFKNELTRRLNKNDSWDSFSEFARPDDLAKIPDDRLLQALLEKRLFDQDRLKNPGALKHLLSSTSFYLVNEKRRVHVLAELIQSKVFDSETRDEIYEAIYRIKDSNERKRLYELAKGRVEPIFQSKEHWLGAMFPPGQNAKELSATDILGLALMVPVNGDEEDRLMATAKLGCSDFLPFQLIEANDDPPVENVTAASIEKKPARVEVLTRSARYGEPAKAPLSEERKKEFFKRHAKRLSEHTETCLKTANLDAKEICYAIQTLNATNFDMYKVTDLIAPKYIDPKTTLKDRVAISQCLLPIVRAPKTEGEKSAVKMLFSRVVPAHRMDDRPGASEEYAAFEKISTAVKRKPVEPFFLETVKELAFSKKSKVSACDMVCGLRKSAPDWRNEKFRSRSDYMESMKEETFAEDMIFNMFDLRSAPLCGAALRPAKEYLVPLPYGLKGFTPEARTEFAQEIKDRENAVSMVNFLGNTGKFATAVIPGLGKQVRSQASESIDHWVNETSHEILNHPVSYPNQLTNIILYSGIFASRFGDEFGDQIGANEKNLLNEWQAPVKKSMVSFAAEANKARQYRGFHSVFSSYSLGLLVLWSQKADEPTIREMRKTAEKANYACKIPYSRWSTAYEKDDAVYRSVIYYQALQKHETTGEGKSKAAAALRTCLGEYATREVVGRVHAIRGSETHVGRSNVAPYYHYSTLFLAVRAAYDELEKLPKDDKVERLKLEWVIESFRDSLDSLYNEKNNSFVTTAGQHFVRRPGYINPLYGLAAAEMCKRDHR